MATSNPSNETKRKQEDTGWEYGRLLDPNNRDRVQCKLCGNINRAGINRLKHHIAGIRGNVAPCSKATKEDQQKMRNALDEIKSKKKSKVDDKKALRDEVRINRNDTTDRDEMEVIFGEMKSRLFGPMDRFTSTENVPDKGKGKQAKLDNLMRKEQVILLKEYVCRWAYQCAIPFNAIDNDSFRSMAEAFGRFGSNPPTPSRYELGETYLKKEVERTKDLLKRNQDEWKMTGCSIMTDAWTDRKKRSIMNMCVNSKLGTVFLSSKECSGEAHTSRYIFEYVEKCIVEIGPEVVVQVVTDNAANNMGAAKILKEKRPSIFWTSCGAHTVDLMLEGIGESDPYKSTIEIAKRITKFIYAHHKTLALMRRYTNKMEIVRPGVTRFASAFLTLQSLIDKKDELRKMFCGSEWDKCYLSKTKKGNDIYKMVMDNM
ncbi:uncharacterized protein [Rutidosis leptorrhynchoides]|uniref:uncharacterized protein n=1 Tax=Rutidosis leptorrhynchoides TaxID=125765 RepID=UPI003A996040